MSSGPAHPGVLVGVDGSPSSRVAGAPPRSAGLSDRALARNGRQDHRADPRPHARTGRRPARRRHAPGHKPHVLSTPGERNTPLRGGLANAPSALRDVLTDPTLRLRVRGRRRCVGARLRGGQRGVDRGARAAAPRCRGGARGVFVRFRRAWCVAGRRRPECRAPRPRRSICCRDAGYECRRRRQGWCARGRPRR